MAASKEKLEFTVEPVTAADMPTIRAIGASAFEDDTHTNLKVFGQAPESDRSAHLDGYLDNPRCVFLKAVSTGPTPEIVGWVCWGHRGYIPRPQQPEATAGRFSEMPGEDAQKLTKIQELENLTDAHFVQFMTDIMPEGTKCWYIVGLNVDPKYQRKGVARALLEFGTRKAQEDGVFAWVHSSEAGWKAYEASGFEIVRELVIDLDEYAEGPAVGKGPREDGKWGHYKFRYMVYGKDNAVGLLGK